MPTLQNKDTALMIFSLSPQQEAGRKRVFGRHQFSASEDFFRLLIEQTSNLATSSGLEVVWMGEHEQRGNGFAERFTNAFQDLYALGYKNVISIGNDCPHLNLANIATAVSQLQSKKLVLGPAQDGGIYLLGMHRSIFNPESFKKLPWQKSRLFEAAVQLACLQNIQFHTLEIHADIDTDKDLLCYLLENPSSVLVQYLLGLLKTHVQFEGKKQKHTYAGFHPKLHSLRAPPVFI